MGARDMLRKNDGKHEDLAQAGGKKGKHERHV